MAFNFDPKQSNPAPSMSDDKKKKKGGKLSPSMQGLQQATMPNKGMC